MFTAFVSLGNAVGWTLFYWLSGGIFEDTETTEIRVFTILAFFICSAVAGISSLICTKVFNSVILRTGSNILSTALAAAPFVLLITPKSMLVMHTTAPRWELFLTAVIIYAIAYLYFFGICIGPTFLNGYGDGLRDIQFFFGKMIALLIVLGAVTLYPDSSTGQEIFSYGFGISIPMSLVLSIYHKVVD